MLMRHDDLADRVGDAIPSLRQGNAGDVLSAKALLRGRSGRSPALREKRARTPPGISRISASGRPRRSTFWRRRFTQTNRSRASRRATASSPLQPRSRDASFRRLCEVGFARQRRLRTGLFTAPPDRYVRSGIDVNDVELRVARLASAPLRAGPTSSHGEDGPAPGRERARRRPHRGCAATCQPGQRRRGALRSRSSRHASSPSLRR